MRGAEDAWARQVGQQLFDNEQAKYIALLRQR
jgi:hypothetical protein